MSAIWYRFRAELRRRWRGWLGLALLAGLAAGTVIALAAGARRTDSAYPRFLEAQNAFDVLVVNYESDGTAIFDFDEIEVLPQVADAARAAWNYVSVGSGAPALAPFDGRLGDEINRLDVLEGHAPDPDRAEEIAVSFTVAEDNDLEVGDTVPILEQNSPGALSPHISSVVLTVISRATILAIIALAIAVPLGFSAGRWLWSVRAGQLGVVAQPQLWPGSLLLVLGATLVLANLIALVPGRAAARTRPAEVLRSD